MQIFFYTLKILEDQNQAHFYLVSMTRDLRLYTNCLLILPLFKSETIAKITSVGQTEERHIDWLMLIAFTSF